MKMVLSILALTMMAAPAHAIHAYGGYSCKTEKLALNYDGPGTNYAVGGYSNFYVEGQEKGLLTYELMEGDQDKVGTEIGEFGKLEVVIKLVSSKEVTKPTGTTVDPKTCEGYEYEESDWKSVRTIKIDQISDAASSKLGLKAGAEIEMNCDESRATPIKCDKD